MSVGRWGESFIAGKFGIETDEGVVIAKDLQCLLESRIWRQGGAVGDSCGGVEDLIVSWILSIGHCKAYKTWRAVVLGCESSDW